MDNVKKLQDKVVIITGSSRGMGRASALLFAEQGAKIVVNYFGNKDAADEVVRKIEELGSEAIAIQADIGKTADHAKLIDGCIERFGKLDILYHNAAVHYVCPELDDVTEEVWDMTYNQVAKGPFFLTKLAIPHLLKNEGANIIFTTTSSSATATPTDPHYMTAKNAVDLMYRIFAGYLSPEIRVNCIVPGFVKTDMFMHHSPEMWETLGSMTPMNRMATTRDIANAALFLASSDASYLTGAHISVDGGRSSAVPRRAIAGLVGTMKPGTGTYDKSAYGADNIKAVDEPV
jgi:3-oxoacyl-[acyl-carrier protein] reductase